MNKKYWGKLFLVSSLILNVNFILNSYSNAENNSKPEEQGEEVYHPKQQDFLPSKKNEEENTKYKVYPKSDSSKVDSLAHTKTVDTKNSTDSEKHNHSKKGEKQVDNENGLNEEEMHPDIPLIDDNTKSSHSMDEEISDNKDKDLKIEANKLVDPDEKIGESKKFNGFFWFIGVFTILLIVIFTFT